MKLFWYLIFCSGKYSLEDIGSRSSEYQPGPGEGPFDKNIKWVKLSENPEKFENPDPDDGKNYCADDTKYFFLKLKKVSF